MFFVVVGDGGVKCWRRVRRVDLGWKRKNVVLVVDCGGGVGGVDDHYYYSLPHDCRDFDVVAVGRYTRRRVIPVDYEDRDEEEGG